MQENRNKDHIKVSNFDIKFKQNIVLHLIDCHQDSPIYQEVIDEFESLKLKIYSLIEPVAIMQFGKLNSQIEIQEFLPGTPVVYTLITVGKKTSEYSQHLFEQGDYLGAMLVNAMADDYLFQLDEESQRIIREECAIRHLGVIDRLESPLNMPMESQKVIIDETNAFDELNIDVTKGYMFTTVKTTAYILVLTEDENSFKAQHNCELCDAVNCKMRKKSSVCIKVMRGDNVLAIKCDENESILDALLRHGQYFSADCGGKGSCGKCKVQLIEGDLDITVQDKVMITGIELDKGYRLSCKAYPKEDCVIKLLVGDESDFEIVTDYQTKDINEKDIPEDSYVIGIDIGTTTIAVNLVGTTSKRIRKTYTTINKQRAYGADVISRMQASNDGKKDLLRECIRKDLLEGIVGVMDGAKVVTGEVKMIAIAGNTTMGHLLMGYSCETLGVFPFIPVNIDTIELPFQTVFASHYLDIPVVLLPGISTYVGGDIVAGLLVCEFDKIEKPCMLIDIGTNGEMAIGNKDEILVSSTAAGPAFEGGNISCGVGSIAGAICNVSIDEEKVIYQTIGGKPPVGICGTGVIEITSELLNAGLIDETGLFDEKYFKDGYQIAIDGEKAPIVFTQRDIREIQLAKSAVRAGIETLIKRSGLTYDMIDTVYLAGGFGYKINIKKAIHIGLLPEEFADKIKVIGNSSLAGAIQYLTDDDARKKVEKIKLISKEIELANDKGFNDLYMDHMFFEYE